MSAAYVEIVFRGNEEDVGAVIEECKSEMAPGCREICFSSEFGLSAEDRFFKWLAALHFTEGHSHVLAPAEALPIFVKKASGAWKDRLSIAAAHEIVELFFRFSFECFNEEHAAVIRNIMENPPEGVVVEGYKPETVVDPTAEGKELYTPVHPFEFRGEGAAKGSAPGILKFFWEIDKEPLINHEKMRIVLGADLLLPDEISQEKGSDS